MPLDPMSDIRTAIIELVTHGRWIGASEPAFLEEPPEYNAIAAFGPRTLSVAVACHF
jgi:hypothetical protein